MARVDLVDLSKILAEKFRDELVKQFSRTPPIPFPDRWILVEAD